MLSGTLFVVLFASRYVNSAIFFTLTRNCSSGIYLLVISPGNKPFVPSFYLSKNWWPFLLLVLRFWNAKYNSVPCFFVDRIKKWNSNHSVSTLTSKNISGTFFFLCFSLNIFFEPFSGIFNCKSLNNSYLVKGYIPNKPSTQSFLFCWKLKI